MIKFLRKKADNNGKRQNYSIRIEKKIACIDLTFVNNIKNNVKSVVRTVVGIY